MKFSWSIFLLFISIGSFGQNQSVASRPAFEDEIRAFEKMDSASPPPKNPILFTGSSSIRMWEHLSADFPGKAVLNRGFGGSQLNDVLRYADRIIIPYHPKQIVLYAGENDVAADLTGQQTYERFIALFQYVRRKLPNVPFAFISIKSSPSRRKFFPEMDVANQRIKDYLAKQRNTEFVDIRPVMMGANGQPVPELFRPDSLHMLPAGYQRWTKVLGPFLK